MDVSNIRSWCEEIDALLVRCETRQNPTDGHARAIVRQLHSILSRAPDNVKPHLGPCFEDSGLESLLELGALETILFRITRSVGLMISRAPSGRAIATVSVPDLNIECSFSSESSLGVAMAGAIASAALELLEGAPDPHIRIV